MLSSISVTSQSDFIQQPNSIVFGEFGFGTARFNNNRALDARASINYQYNNIFFLLDIAKPPLCVEVFYLSFLFSLQKALIPNMQYSMVNDG